MKEKIWDLFTLKFLYIFFSILIIGSFFIFYAIANAQLKDQLLRIKPDTQGDYIYKQIAPSPEKTRMIETYNQNEEIIKRLDRIIYLLEK